MEMRRRENMDLFLVSVLALYLELLLIRWVATEINLFAYLQNAILVVCFLGLGIGCLRGGRVTPSQYLVPLGLLVLMLCLPPSAAALRKVSSLLTTLGDVNALEALAFGSRTEVRWAIPIGLGITFGVMILIWQVFVPLGRMLGALMSSHPKPLLAYSVNIAGSLVGIGAFVLLGVLEQPPAVWFLTAGVPLAYFILREPSRRAADILLLCGVLAVPLLVSADPGALRVLWSPYQKLVLTRADSAADYPSYRYFVTVNNTSYQGIMDLSRESVAAQPTHFPPAEAGLSQYDIPYLVHPRPRRVLIVGSGSGNDVAGALRAGVEHVTAVEIDPAIIEFGREFHPERPYASPRVTVVNDDARAFFATSDERFDVISFGLLDSHTTTAMTNARLDHYVYTRESIAMARRLLAPGGVMTLNFAAHRDFIGD
ncbi:MAG TPA: methyltransferase domain-containing protein, partial [Gemmatimonadales bacterium]|nr:methyltransferase domain-containing protein [Gemmatimonadales bacterium]